MAEEERQQAEITVKRIGPGRPTTIRVPTPLRVIELKRTVAEKNLLHAEELKLILRGRTLSDRGISGEDAVVDLKNGDTLIAAIIPKPPAKYLNEGLDEEDDDDLKFRVPENMERWKLRAVKFLQNKLMFPDFLLIIMFSISLRAWFGVILWFVLAPIAHRWNLGPLFILATGFTVILFNLGKRQDGDASAYSIFNEDFRELPGTLNANRLDRDIRTGQF